MAATMLPQVIIMPRGKVSTRLTEPAGQGISLLAGGDLGEVRLRGAQCGVPEVQRCGIHQQGHHAGKVLHDVPVEHLPHGASEHLPQLHRIDLSPCKQDHKASHKLHRPMIMLPGQLLHPLHKRMCNCLSVCMHTHYAARGTTE